MWRFLNSPDAFRRDWYGELTNQCGHTLLGVVSALVFVGIWREATGEMPYRGVAFFCAFLPYAILVEWRIQSWRPGDSWFDCVMFMFGAGAALAPFKEVTAHGGFTLLRFDHRALGVIVSLWAVFLILRVWKRYRAQHG